MSQNYTVITIGFKSGLNYPFVVAHSLASAQIFQYLPGTLTFPFSEENEVAVKQLVPFQSPSLNYIVTIAEVYYPKDWISALNESLQTSYSKFYFNPDATENSLAQLIDVNIPLLGLGGASTRGSSSAGATSSSGANSGGTDGFPSSSYGSFDSVQDSHATANKKLGLVGTTSGISAAVYISVLLVGFRMYKQRKGSLPFSTEQTGNIVLPVADDASGDETDFDSQAAVQDPNVIVNPVYSEGPVERRMSYASFKSYLTSGDLNNYSADAVDQLTVDQYTIDEEDEKDLDEIDNIIPHMSHPMEDNWI